MGTVDVHADERFMREALAEAALAAEAGEVPIGAVVVHDGTIVARAHNLREHDEDPSAHAEFRAMVAAARALGRWRLFGCTVYVTLEPCLMCAGLMVNARIDRCVYGARDPKGGAVGSLFDVSRDRRLNHAFSVTAGVLEDECAQVLKTFFADTRRRGAREVAPELLQRAFEASVSPCPQQLPAPQVLLAVDAFKDSASSADAEAWIAEGIRHACPGARITALPIADGGEGTLDAMEAARTGTRRTLTVCGPLDTPVRASYLLATTDAGPIAVIEMAEAAGIAYSPRTHEAALRASTYGVGQLVLDACEHGVREIYFAIGGSATNDGGAGLLQALGAQLLDAQGAQIPRGLAGLEHVRTIDLRPTVERLAGCRLVVLSDVDNPLVGARGALSVFGPQKGLGQFPGAVVEGDDSAAADSASADPAAGLRGYDAWMVAYGCLLDEARTAADIPTAPGARRFRSVLGVPGGGAAGGLGAALLALGAQLSSGADAVLDLVGFDDAVRSADLVVTGEGFMDEQSVAGKAPIGVARRAKRWGKPVIAVVGGRADCLDGAYGCGIDLVLPATRRPMALERALTCEETRANLRCAGEAAIRAFLLGRR